MQSQTEAAQARESARETAREAAREAAQQVREIQQAMREGAQEGARDGRPDVEVRTTDGGQVVLITDAQGNTRRIEIGNDGRVLSGVTETGTAVAPVAPPAPRRKELPGGLVELVAIVASMVAISSIGTPIAKAWARRYERRHDEKQQAMVEQRLEAIERAIDSVAVEVERISEGQRFTTRLLSERAPAEMERVR